MNTVSALVGVVLIPIAGIACELFPGVVLYKILNIGTFNPGTWTVTFLLAILINAALETQVLRHVYKQKTGKRVFWWLCGANSLSVGLAFVSLFLRPPEP